MEGTTVLFQIVGWSILPFINTVIFIMLCFYVVLCNKPLNTPNRILFFFTGGTLLWSYVSLHILWLPMTIPLESIIFEPSALLETYTYNIVILGAIFLGVLGIAKLVELFNNKKA